jgi:hypothetical protein
LLWGETKTEAIIYEKAGLRQRITEIPTNVSTCASGAAGKPKKQKRRKEQKLKFLSKKREPRGNTD